MRCLLRPASSFDSRLSEAPAPASLIYLSSICEVAVPAILVVGDRIGSDQDYGNAASKKVACVQAWLEGFSRPATSPFF